MKIYQHLFQHERTIKAENARTYLMGNAHSCTALGSSIGFLRAALCFAESDSAPAESSSSPIIKGCPLPDVWVLFDLGTHWGLWAPADSGTQETLRIWSVCCASALPAQGLHRCFAVLYNFVQVDKNSGELCPKYFLAISEFTSMKELLLSPFSI